MIGDDAEKGGGLVDDDAAIVVAVEIALVGVDALTMRDACSPSAGLIEAAEVVATSLGLMDIDDGVEVAVVAAVDSAYVDDYAIVARDALADVAAASRLLMI